MATDSPTLTERLTSSRMVSGPSGLLTSLRSPCATSIALAAALAIGSRAVSGRRADILVKFLLWLALVAVVAPLPLRAAQSPAAPTLLVLGDSLSAAYGIRVEEGWVALLAARLAEKGYGYRVVNASISGETSSGALARLPHLLASQQPGFLIVEIGANDGLRGLPLADI